MSQAKPTPIKALGGYDKKSPTENLVYARGVHSEIYTDPAHYYPTPPVDEPTFKDAIDTLSAKITAALDGGKKAIAERNHQEQVVIKMMRQLSNYAEEACKDDMTTFLKSGFQAKSTVRAGSQSLSQWIRKITPGKISGQIRLVPVAADGATAYEFRCVPTVNGVPGTPVTQLVTKTRPAATISGLTPGMTYTIQVRSFADATGFTDWSDPVIRIVT